MAQDGFFTTRVLVSVEIQTQFGPSSAIKLVLDRLPCPAVGKIEIIECATDYPSLRLDADLSGVPIREL